VLCGRDELRAMRLDCVWAIALWATVAQVACGGGRHLTFEHLKDAERVEVRTNHDRLVRKVEDAVVMADARAFILAHADGWETPWYGTPVPRLQVNFYRGERLIGGFGVGRDFLTTDPGPVFMSRSVQGQDVEELLRRLSVAMQSE
jgi:hypothetical protein